MRYKNIERSLVINEKGVVFGAALLAKFVRGALHIDEPRILTLLSVACLRAVSPDVVGYIHAAGKAYKRGDKTLALMHLALTGVHALSSIEEVDRITNADRLLKSGVSPCRILKRIGIDKESGNEEVKILLKVISKYNPYHLGLGPGGGQFTTADRDGQSNGVPPGAVHGHDTGVSIKPSSGIPAGGTQVAGIKEEIAAQIAAEAEARTQAETQNTTEEIVPNEIEARSESIRGAIESIGDAIAAAPYMNPNGTLVNAENGVISPSKIMGYVLNPNNDSGSNKAIVFNSALGYNQSNADGLIQQLQQGVSKYPATVAITDEHGQRFTVDIPVTGPNGNTAMVRTGWIFDIGSDKPRLITAFIKK